MRGLFRYCPPRIVSAKCTFQLSRSSTFASAAAMPPSAITVCALPSRDLVTTPTETPAAEASRPPADPPRLRQSPGHHIGASHTPPSEDPPVVPDAHGAQPDIDIREGHPEETAPRPGHMAGVQTTDAVIYPFANRRAGEPVQNSSHEMSQRMTTERITAQQNHIQQ